MAGPENQLLFPTPAGLGPALTGLGGGAGVCRCNTGRLGPALLLALGPGRGGRLGFGP